MGVFLLKMSLKEIKNNNKLLQAQRFDRLLLKRLVFQALYSFVKNQAVKVFSTEQTRMCLNVFESLTTVFFMFCSIYSIS